MYKDKTCKGKEGIDYSEISGPPINEVKNNFVGG